MGIKELLGRKKEQVLAHNVDVVTPASLRPRIRDRVLKEAVSL